MFVAASVCYWVSLKQVVHKYLFGMDTFCCLITLPGYLLHYGFWNSRTQARKYRYRQLCLILDFFFFCLFLSRYVGSRFVTEVSLLLTINNNIYLLIYQLKLLWGGKLQFVLIFYHTATVYQFITKWRGFYYRLLVAVSQYSLDSSPRVPGTRGLSRRSLPWENGRLL